MASLRNFEHLALVHMDAAYNLAYWLVRDRADAEDVVQDAYLRAFRAFDTLTGDDIKPWLLTIVRHVAYRWLTVRKRRTNVIPLDAMPPAFDRDEAGPVREIASDAPSAEDVLLGRADQALVHRALAELPPAFRETIILRELEEMSYQDIARVTEVPIGTVMSRLARARDQLREQLTELMARENRNAL
ncbi:MAG TPA: sigma-70 family RNA polymerase sigma factor [Nordella sp.]|nr:sigma-70 family RNA polymerase sigma factor [Nordella sp.]